MGVLLAISLTRLLLVIVIGLLLFALAYWVLSLIPIPGPPDKRGALRNIILIVVAIAIVIGIFTGDGWGITL
jgi:hypothetical protein